MNKDQWAANKNYFEEDQNMSKPINADGALNMMTVVITRTRLFATQYQEWYGRDPSLKTFVHAFEFWGHEVRLMKNTTAPRAPWAAAKNMG